MNNIFLKNFIIVSFISILVTRFIPHPPNFTSAIALTFYLPAIFGFKFLIVALTAFIISDFFIGIHQLIFFTWGSLLLIGCLSKFFKIFYLRFLGIIVSCFLFFIISNFGVWLLTSLYEFSLSGLLACYTMAIPFLQNSLISSLFFSMIIELILIFKSTQVFIRKVNPNY